MSEPVKIIFLAPEDLGGGTEGLWARPVSPSIYRLDNIPLKIPGIALGDMVSASVGRSGHLEFVGVIERSGHSTYTIYAPSAESDERPERVWRKLESIGCTRERRTTTMWAIDVPPGALQKAFDIIEAARLEEIWLYDELYAHVDPTAGDNPT